MRTLVVWCPDWPVVAAVLSGEVAGPEAWTRPVAVVHANRVVAASATVREWGVRRGMRRREAQACCPDVEVIASDPGRDARTFEPVVAAVCRFSPTVEIVAPGICQLVARGPARYFGGDEPLAQSVVEAIAAVGVVGRVGIAEGPFAAQLAARATTAHAPWRIIEPGRTTQFLGPIPVAAAARAIGDLDFGDLLVRLGIRSLGQLAELPASDVAARFGPSGERARHLAAGLDPDAVRPTPIPPDLVVGQEFEEPLERIDAAAFVARTLADDLHRQLADRGLSCACICIEARFADGSETTRRWRHERAGAPGGLTPAALGDRVRWQLDGWLLSRRDTPGSGITHLRLVPESVIGDVGRQLGFWGASEADERADRAFARVQGLLGPEAVQVAEIAGGRGPDQGIRLMAWGDARSGPDGSGAATRPASRAGRGRGRVRKAAARAVPSVASGPGAGDGRGGSDPGAGRTGGSGVGRSPGDGPAPWPGGLPAPLPTLIHDPAHPVDVLDDASRSVRVTARALCSAAPSVLVRDGRPEPIVGWAGPWPVEERWWDLATGRRQARFQIQTASGVWLVVLEAGAWWIAATYG